MSCFLLFPALILGGAYVALMLACLLGWLMQKELRFPEDFIPKTKISIIIPARNEAGGIGQCIESILAQDYPDDLFELIIVDDFSEDDTAAVVREFTAPKVKLVQLRDIVPDRNKIVAFKKEALSAGIAQSTGTLIITTDADCTAGPFWLKAMAAAYELHKPEVIIAPVDFRCKNSLLELFQSLDFMTMQGITGAAQKLRLGHMANGANFAFKRAAYDAVNGYDGTMHIASGDDYLMLVKMAAVYPERIHYLRSKDAIIYTTPQPTWNALLNQRIRWASKSGKYKDNRLTIVLILVYLFNLTLAVLFFAAFFNTAILNLFLVLFTVKILVEILFLAPVSGFFSKRWQLIIFPFLQPLHIIYISLAGFLGYIGKYEWKGRQLR